MGILGPHGGLQMYIYWFLHTIFNKKVEGGFSDITNFVQVALKMPKLQGKKSQLWIMFYA